MNLLFTEEGKNVSKECPLSEHPNPQFRRDSYACLNGEWDFSLLPNSKEKIEQYQTKILVPFAVETALSGVGIQDVKGKFLHYRKVFDLPQGIDKEHVCLHFEAVDCSCDVYLNGVHLGHHDGGYSPFCFANLTLLEKGNDLRVIVKDDTSGEYPIGKQSLKPGGIWYHATSGIYGSVWLENIPGNHLTDIRYEIHRKMGICTVFAKFSGKNDNWFAEVSFQGKPICREQIDVEGKANLYLGEAFHEWTPESPNLYDVKFSNGEDTVYSYFGMRKISVGTHKGYPFPMLNGKPIFMTGPLDQGYFPESGLTPPTDQAMINDILAMKTYGFNMIRKHIKVEPRRWYYHCDRLGMLVMQDFVNIGAPYNPFIIMTGPFVKRKWDDTKERVQKRLHSRSDFAKANYLFTMESTVDLLKNHPSIVVWTIFNEGWGQFNTKDVYERLKQLDESRLIDANSGWIDQGVGDFSSHHVYFIKPRLHSDHKRILSLSEFGGYSYKENGHTMMDKAFGYKKLETKEKLEIALRKLFEEQIIPLKKEGLAVAVYTQLSDVEEEINGLLTYDRQVQKVDLEVMKELNAKLKEL